MCQSYVTVSFEPFYVFWFRRAALHWACNRSGLPMFSSSQSSFFLYQHIYKILKILKIYNSFFVFVRNKIVTTSNEAKNWNEKQNQRQLGHNTHPSVQL